MYILYAVSFLSPSSIAYPKGSSPLKKFWFQGSKKENRGGVCCLLLFTKDLGREAFIAFF